MFRGGRGGARYDNFRARVQNTSRPPSMHVDDFVAMESGRGRGRGRGGQSPMSERSATRPSIRKVGVDSGRIRGGKSACSDDGAKKSPSLCESKQHIRFLSRFRH